MKGQTLPRLYTLPLPDRREGNGCVPGCTCGLSVKTSHGFAVIRWARSIGIKLHPWQRWLLIHGLELDHSLERYRFRTCLVLVARQNGKTLVKMLLTLWRLYELNTRLIVGTAQDLSQAKEVMNEGLIPMMLGHPKLSERFDPDNRDRDVRAGIWHKTLGDEYFRLDDRGGPRYLIKALNASSGRGLWEVGEVNIDELRTQTDFLGWASISKVVMAATNAQIWCMSNAGDDRALLLNHLRSIAIAGTDDAMFHAEWSAEDGCELDDPRAQAQANPSLGYGRLTEDAIRSALATDPPAVFRTEVLCQSVPTLNAAIDMAGWAACADRTGTMDDHRDRLALCVEVAQDGAHVAAIVAAELPDGRVRLETVGAWQNTQDARRALPDLKTLIRPKVFGWFPTGPGAALSATMRKLKGVEIKGTAIAESCMTLADYVDGRRVLQPDDPLLDAHIARTSRVGTKGSWAFDRAGAEHVDAAFAAAGAMYLAMNMKRGVPRRGVLLPSEIAG